MVQILGYSKEIAEEILKKFYRKGWNLYKYDKELGREGVIKQNLAETLEVNTPYIWLPVVHKPRDPKYVMSALELIGEELNGETPTIKIGSESYGFTGITLRESEVKVHTPEGTYIPYPTFIDSLESLIEFDTPY